MPKSSKFKLGDKSIFLETNQKVFKPNLTTICIIEALKKIKLKKKINILDMGCGSGVIGIFIKKFLSRKSKVVMVDFSQYAVSLAKKNSKKNNVKIEIFKSNVFDNVKGKFDLIIDDISAIDEKIAKKFWYNKFIPHKCGSSGINLTTQVIKKAPFFLKKSGILILPVISLSNYQKVEKNLKKKFKSSKILIEKTWPAPLELKRKFESLLKTKKHYIFDKYGISLCFTRIYMCVK